MPKKARLTSLFGPALVAGVAYLDPGNVASNMTAGARFGYLLVWVVVIGNVTAWLVQYLSAKLGIVTGSSLSQLLGDRIAHRWARRAYWLQAEAVAIATDIAEVIGGAVALWLLFGIPLVWGAVITGAVSLVLLWIQHHRGARPFEFVIMGMLALIAIGFMYGLFLSPPDLGATLAGIIPRFQGTNSVLLAASILGATVMPHAIYAHSALARDRFGGSNRSKGSEQASHILRATRWDVTLAMVIAGTVNLSILLLAAHNLAGATGTDSLQGAHDALAAALGPVVATLFAFGLLASGLASTSVGAYAGAEIMQGLLHVRVPMLLRRLVTLIPAIVVLALGIDPTEALVLSQVVLSFGIPFALVPLISLTRRADLMGVYRNRAITTAAGVLAAAFLIALNALLLWLVFAGGGYS